MKCSLPVPYDSILSLGMNPLKEETKHRDWFGQARFMEFAWDFLIPRNTPVYSALPGKVFLSDTNSNIEPTELETQVLRDTFVKGWNDKSIRLAKKLYSKNNRIIIQHNTIFSYYAHINSSIVQNNQLVEEGELIGFSGNIGCSTDPHLHFELFQPKEDVLPIYAIDGIKRDRRISVPVKFNGYVGLKQSI